MPVILEDDFLVAGEIIIHSETNPLLNNKQEEELTIKHCEPFLKVTDNNIPVTERYTSDEKNEELTDIQQKKKIQFEVHKPLTEKKITEGKRIHILSDEKIFYTSTMKNAIKLKPITSRPRTAKDYENNYSSQPKPGPSRKLEDPVIIKMT